MQYSIFSRPNVLMPIVGCESEAEYEVAHIGPMRPCTCCDSKNERKFLETHCGKMKIFLQEQGIQRSGSGKGNKLFDLYKKVEAIKQIKLASFPKTAKQL